jgi:hypothetical protein
MAQTLKGSAERKKGDKGSGWACPNWSDVSQKETKSGQSGDEDN